MRRAPVSLPAALRRGLAFAFAALACGPALVAADGIHQHERVLARLPAGERAALREFSTLHPTSLARVAEATAPAALAGRMEALLALDSLNPATRAIDADGLAGVHRWLDAELARLAPAGVQVLGHLRGQVPVPVSLDRREDPARREPPARLTVDGTVFPVAPLWPNGAMPSLAPRGGLRGPLVDVGDAGWDALRGQPVPGSIALMDFRGGRAWDRVFALGAQAIIVIEDDFVALELAEQLFSLTPVPAPRFYVDRTTGARLRALAARGAEGTLTGGSVFENRPWRFTFAYLPPTAPVEHTVLPGELLDRIAASYGLSGGSLAEANRLPDRNVAPGTSLRIPGRAAPHVVAPDELLRRLAARYGLPLADLRAANPALAAGDPPPGTSLFIPNASGPLVISVALDAMSVVPDAPHGARTAGNLAVATALLEHLATDSMTPRRRGVIFAFVDADTLGGVGTRTFAEYVQLVRGHLPPPPRLDGASQLSRLQAALAWFDAPTQQVLSDDHARWLGEQWLAGRLEERRIAAAEARIQILATDGPDAPTLAAANDRLAALVALRDQTLGRPVGWPARIDALRARLTAPTGGEHPALELDWSALRARLARETAEEAFRTAAHADNLAAAARVLEQLHPAGVVTPRLGYHLDLGDGSAALGLTHTNLEDYREAVSMDAATPRRLAQRLQHVVATAHTTAGWGEAWTFATDLDRRDFPTLENLAPPFHPEFWVAAEVGMLSLGTLNDRLTRVDTPHDTVDRLHLPHLAVQARTLTVALQHALESPPDSAGPSRLASPRYSRLTGRTVQFNIRSGIDAQDPVPGVLVMNPATKSVPPTTRSPATHRGYRRSLFYLTPTDGSYTMPVESRRFSGLNHLYAYRLDRDAATFTKVANRGIVGTKRQTPAFQPRDGANVEKNLVMADLVPWVFFASNDPMNYRAIGGERGKATHTFGVVDAVRQGEPPQFALDNPALDFVEKDLSANILYLAPGRRARVVTQDRINYTLLLTGPVVDGRGRGYAVGPLAAMPPADGAPLDPATRNLTLPHTPLHIARDFLAMADHRLALFREHGIRAQALEDATARARDKIAEAEEALATRNWQGSEGAAREAWGIMVKNYPRLLGLGREAVFSVILLMALLLPACIFLERLLLSGRGIVRQLIGVTALFTAGTLFLNAFHPAFQIAVSPFIVVVAFTMIVMSVAVLVLCYQRFDVLLRRARQQGGEVEADEIGLLSSLQTAVSLGVANLKKRPGRSGLTAFTVATLTFSIVAFVSVTGRDALSFRPLDLDRDIEGTQVDPLPPAYDGLLFRTFNWLELGSLLVNTVRSEFGARHTVAARGFYLEVEGGAGMDREGANQIAIDHPDSARRTLVRGLMTFEPAETQVSGLHRAVHGAVWFRPDDRFHVILPDTAAAELGITPGQVLTPDGQRRPDSELPVVRFQNHTWRVIGILDTSHADRIRDINGKSLALVDHLRSAMSASATGDELLNEAPSVHLSWSRAVLLPLRAGDDVLARVRSLAVKFAPGSDDTQELADLALRLNRTLFIHTDGRLGLLGTVAKRDVAGLAAVLVPVVLCVLIVLNTMLGTVEERKGEVGMLGAIGLSPRQIAFLLLSESTVYSVLGIVVGVFAGLGLANTVPWLSASGVTIFEGLSLNFTSLTSMLLALATGGVVLLATLIPARRAAALAAPGGMAAWQLPAPQAAGRLAFALPFTLTRGNAAGMLAFFRQFLASHSEPTSADFNCRHVTAAGRPETGARITADMWLAPYDLDVAQRFALEIRPSELPGVYRVSLLLERRSGSEEAWLRTNYAFLNLVRQQFLLWRNLTPAQRESYIAQSAALTVSGNVVHPAPGPTS